MTPKKPSKTDTPPASKKDNRPLLLITGAAGGLASLLVEEVLKEYRLVGVDPRPMPRGKSFPGEFYQLNYTHRRMAEVFRQHAFHAVIHLGRIGVSSRVSTGSRYNVNVLGTRNILALAKKHQIPHVLVCSTFHVYGAHQFNHVHITEDAPLRASQTFPELVDAIELDHTATTFMWRHRDIRTVVLRPVNVIGSRIKNTMSRFLRSDICPHLMGYDPLLQFIHEKDLAHALYLSLKGNRGGIYNIAGEGAVAYSKAIELSGAIAVPVPTFIAYPLVDTLSRFKLAFPKHLIDYFRYPTVISDREFRRDFHYQPKVTTAEALASLRD